MSEHVRAAKAILKAQMDRENSWNGKNYLKSDRECYNQAYDEYKIPEHLKQLLLMCNLWWNDIQEWAENIIDTELGER